MNIHSRVIVVTSLDYIDMKSEIHLIPSSYNIVWIHYINGNRYIFGCWCCHGPHFGAGATTVRFSPSGRNQGIMLGVMMRSSIVLILSI